MNITVTRRGEYGLTAATYLACQDPSELKQIHEIAGHCDLPEPFLAQILRRLVLSGLVRSKKGARGGFQLARPAAEISYLNVLEALEGPVAVNQCQHPSGCDHTDHCAMESVWDRAQRAFTDVLKSAYLSEGINTELYPGNTDQRLAASDSE
jgi:Rrf2 family protein